MLHNANDLGSNPGSTNTTNGYSIVKNIKQTRNNGDIVLVTEEVIDDTEGLGAIDTLPLSPGEENLDLGGGKFDTVTQHMKYFYNVNNKVYDPYNRSPEHNQQILHDVKCNPVDSVTSISVLNVILDAEVRTNHIQLAYDSLKKSGTAFFKVYRGNGNGVADAEKYQSNLSAASYINEIKDIFGADVCIPKDDIGNTIIAKKNGV